MSITSIYVNGKLVAYQARVAKGSVGQSKNFAVGLHGKAKAYKLAKLAEKKLEKQFPRARPFKGYFPQKQKNNRSGVVGLSITQPKKTDPYIATWWLDKDGKRRTMGVSFTATRDFGSAVEIAWLARTTILGTEALPPLAECKKIMRQYARRIGVL